MRPVKKINRMAEGQNGSEQSDEYRFAEKLADEPSLLCAHYFPDAYFLCPFLAAGGRQVHKVDAGNEQDKCRDNTKHPHSGYTSAGGFAVFKIAVQPSLAELVQEYFDLFLAIEVFNGNVLYLLIE